MKLRILATTTLLSVFALGAFAQTSGPAATPRIDARQANQEKRIDQGIASGELTQRETKKLEAEQSRIDRVEDRAKADGTVTKKERKHLTHMQNKASADIARQKHDAQEKPRAQ